MIDDVGRKIIAQRNGVQLGAAKQLPPPDPQIPRVAAAVQTNRQARQLLGIAATHLQQAYRVVETIPSNMWWGVLKWARYFDGSHNLAQQARSLLDNVNKHAQQLYAALPNNDAAVAPTTQKRVQLLLNQASSGLQLVSSSANEMNKSLIDDLIDAINGWANEHIPAGLPKIPRGATKIVVYVALGVAGLVGLVIAGRLLHSIVLGRSELTEAENEAMAIADAARRKRSSRSVLSIV